MDKAVDCTRAETEADTCDQYIGAELQLPNKDLMKTMARFPQIVHNVDGNTEINGNYRLWTDHTEY